MRWICIMLPLALLSACYGTTEYQQVLIPSVCDVQKRERPQKSGVLLEDIKAILIYDELLQRDLAFCRGKQPP